MTTYSDQTSVIYGIRADGGLGELLNFDAALKNLGLDPRDLKAVGAIKSTSTGLDENEFYTLSGYNGNLFRKLSNYYRAAQDIVLHVEKSAGANVSVKEFNRRHEGIHGNIVVNGPIGAPAIRYFSTSLLNASNGNFEPLDISTSRVSSWSRSGSTISYGGSLLVDSLGKNSNYTSSARSGYSGAGTTNSPSLGVGQFIIDGTANKTLITPRTFSAEQATHKLKATINGKTLQMFAMKNIPLRFEGTFAGRGGSRAMATVNVTGGGNTSFRFIRKSNNATSDTVNQSQAFLSDTAEVPRILEIYTNPKNITSLNLSNNDLTDSGGNRILRLNLENFPNAEFDELTTLQFGGNNLKTLPNLKRLAPKLATCNFRNNLLNESPEGGIGDKRFGTGDSCLSQHLLNKLPAGTSATDTNGVKILNFSQNFSGIVLGDFKKTFPNLTELNIRGRESGSINSPAMPEIPSTCTIYDVGRSGFKSIPGTAVTKTIHDVSLQLDGSNAGKGKLRIRRKKDLFDVVIDSPGLGYSNGLHTFSIHKSNTGFANSQVRGASSPFGIPFGNVVISVSGGKIVNANFSPAGVVGPRIQINNGDTPSSAAIRIAGRAFATANNIGNEFVGLGYYVDGGLFSSPMSLEDWRMSGEATLSGINNRHHAYMNLDGQNNSYPSIKNLSWSGIDRPPIPNLANTSLERVDIYSGGQFRDIFLDNNFSTQRHYGGIDSVQSFTVDDFAELYTLVDSPTNGYKFSGCNELRAVEMQYYQFRGKFPKFTGNSKITNWRTETAMVYDHQNSTDNSPFALPHDQFDACLDTLQDVRILSPWWFGGVRGQRFFRDEARRGIAHQKPLPDGTTDFPAVPKRFRTDGSKASSADRTALNSLVNFTNTDARNPLRINFKEGSTTASGVNLRTRYYPFNQNRILYQPAPFQTKDSPDGLTCWSKLSQVRIIRWHMGTTGDLPDFRARTRKSDFNCGLHYNRFGMDYSYTLSNGKTKSFVAQPFDEYRGMATENLRIYLRHWYLLRNKLHGNISFIKLGGEDGNTNANSLYRLWSFQIYDNDLTRIEDFGGNAGLRDLRDFRAYNAFRGKDNANVGSSKTKYVLPTTKDKLPNLQMFDVRSTLGKGTGPFSGFENESEHEQFKGNKRRNLTIRLDGNALSQDSIIHLLKSLKNLKNSGTQVSGNGNMVIGLSNQKDATDGQFTDFRLESDGGTAPRSLEDNDLIEELVRTGGQYKFTISGIKHSKVPPAPDAPNFTVTFDSFPTNRQLASGNNFGPQGTSPGTIYSAASSGINVTLNINAANAGTTKLIIERVQWDGDVKVIAEKTTGIGTSFTQSHTISTIGDDSDINIGVTDYATDNNWEHEVQFRIRAEGIRGFGAPKTQTVKFINITNVS